MSGVKIIPIGKPRTVRQRLLEALGDLLARQGFDGLSLESVSRAAGLERAVVLRHFQDLDDMVTASARAASAAAAPPDTIPRNETKLQGSVLRGTRAGLFFAALTLHTSRSSSSDTARSLRAASRCRRA